MTWKQGLRHDPMPVLSASEDLALAYFVRRDLSGEGPGQVEALWELPEVEKILGRQLDDGSWKYPGDAKKRRKGENYNLLQTYRNLGVLIEQYGMDRTHPAIARAAHYVYAHQTEDGDFRGIFGTQPAPHYTAGLAEW